MLKLGILCEKNICLDDIRLEGHSISGRVHEPYFRKIPEQFPEPWMMLAIKFEDRLLGIEQELNQITALLSQQQFPDIKAKVEAELAKFAHKGSPGSKRT